jgi:CHASE3 domain sensor protein
LQDNISQSRLLASSEPLVISRSAVTGEAIRLHAAGDRAGITALTTRAEGRSLMDSIDTKFDLLAKEEQRLLGVRAAESARTRSQLFAIDLSCVGLILVLAMILIRAGRRSSRKREALQRTRETAK